MSMNFFYTSFLLLTYGTDSACIQTPCSCGGQLVLVNNKINIGVQNLFIQSYILQPFLNNSILGLVCS